MEGVRALKILSLFFVVITSLIEWNTWLFPTSNFLVHASFPSSLILAKESRAESSAFSGVTRTVDLPNLSLAPLERPASLWESSSYLIDGARSAQADLDADLLPDPPASSPLGRSFSKYLQFVSVKRKMQVMSNYVKVNVALQLMNVLTAQSVYPENEGLAIDGSIRSFHLLFPAHEAVQIGGLRVSSAPQSDALQVILETLTPMKSTAPLNTLPPTRYGVVLKMPLKPQDVVSLDISYTLGRPFLPWPEKIDVSDRQFVKLSLYSIWLSPYAAKEEMTTIELMHDILVSKTHFEALEKQGLHPSADKKWSTGTLKKIQANTVGKPLKFYFEHEHALPFLFAAEKRVDVSYWGNVHFHEYYYLHNEAAAVKGEFSRLDYWRKTNDIMHSNMPLLPSSFVTRLVALFPLFVRNFEYFDELGNISTSKIVIKTKGREKCTSFTMTPRFPVVGGWNTFWQLQYNLPAESALRQDTVSHSTVLTIPFSPGYSGLYIEDYHFSVVLPNGAHNIHIESPIPLDSNETSIAWSWFDIFQGRPMLHLYKHGMLLPASEILKAKIIISYDTNSSVFLQPFTLVLLFLIPLLVYLFLGRLKMRICTVKEGEQMDIQEVKNILMKALLEQLENLMHYHLKYSESILNSVNLNKDLIEEIVSKWQKESADVRKKIEDLIISQRDELIAPSKQLIPLVKALTETMEDMVLREHSLNRATSPNEKKKLLDSVNGLEARLVVLDKHITAFFSSFKSKTM
ncbi:ribophorin i protein [Cardiosporidium cionae]|uniref:Dolichyl-diphosphooligosaccharide--protein glycosyltransferase subunit 1 n=1 Tax=Cardiosporidium cionae TaxID=476202 RepID=A0ABQ7JBV2_9APIC|nr:ribophorin i protein [Cardiosporidium cionae]|eukprot:KAF8821480.1 ribophorin i protein [Cardiosporidium cionae]